MLRNPTWDSFGILSLVAINCAVVPENLIESELFRYIKDAFTDARTDKPGHFGLANAWVWAE